MKIIQNILGRLGDALPEEGLLPEDEVLLCELCIREPLVLTCLPVGAERTELAETIVLRLLLLVVEPLLLPGLPPPPLIPLPGLPPPIGPPGRPESSLKLGFEYVRAPEPDGSRL